MRNECDGIEVLGTVSDMEDNSGFSFGTSEEDRASVQPSGSRTLGRRLNPEAPDFVPGVTNLLLAAKIVDELAAYTRWSNAIGEDISYGPRYDGIWSERCRQAHTEVATAGPGVQSELAQLQPEPRAKNEAFNRVQLIGTVGDMELVQSPEMETEAVPELQQQQQRGQQRFSVPFSLLMKKQRQMRAQSEPDPETGAESDPLDGRCCACRIM